MDLISLLIAIIVVGAAIALLEAVPINATVKRLGYIVVIVFAVIWLLLQLRPLFNMSIGG